MKINWLKLIISVVICNLAGFLGSLATSPQIPGWYATITKPSFNPPNWIFGPVWTTLFILMGIALYLIWENGFEKNKIAIGVFGAQLGLNTLWSFLFFGMQSPYLAFIEIWFLWIAIAASIYLFYKIDKRAAYLLIPYIAWVSFAAFLNYNIWMLN